MSSLELKKKLKFLLDENVKRELLGFLRQQGLDAVFKPKKLSNGILAEFSKSEQRVLVTSDKHFADSSKFPKERIFGFVWLRVPQDKPETLFNAFSKLLEDKSGPDDFEGFLIELEEDGSFKSSPIPSLKILKSKYGPIQMVDYSNPKGK